MDTKHLDKKSKIDRDTAEVFVAGLIAREYLKYKGTSTGDNILTAAAKLGLKSESETQAMIIGIFEMSDKDDKTNGEKINDLVNEYFELYLKARNDEFLKSITDDPRGFALIDLKNKLFVAERAIAELNAKIDDYEDERGE